MDKDDCLRIKLRIFIIAFHKLKNAIVAFLIN